jgi:hypothetical protein
VVFTMSVAVVHAEGVLRKTIGGYFLPEGIRLAQALAQNGQVYVVTDAEAATLTEWLYTETGSRWWDEVEHIELSLATTLRWLRGSRRLGIDLAVCADPGQSAELVAYGFNVLQFTHAEYARPDWRPDYDKSVKAWDQLSKQVADQARMKAQEKPVRED